MNTTTGSQRKHAIKVVATLVAIVALIGVMVANTKFLSTEQAQAVSPAEFDPAAYAQENLPIIVEAVTDNAEELSTIVEAVTVDPIAAGQKYGNVAGTDKYAIPVTLTGVVSAVDANFLTVTVEGIPPEASVRVPLGQAVNGTALRDVTGEAKFADFPDQTAYQAVANELKAALTTDVIGSVDPAALLNTSIAVSGIYVTDSGPENAYVITPVSLESV